MVGFRPHTQDERDQIATALNRAGLDFRDLARLSVSVERQGRFTIVLIEALVWWTEPFITQRLLFSGAARLDSADRDDQETGRRVALAKACRGLVAWLREGKEAV